MKRTITEFQLVDHGIEHEQYFSGCGIAFTPFEYVATGCGNNPAEAVDDCLEQIASGNELVDVDGMEKRICAVCGIRKIRVTPRVKASQDGCHYYVSIRYNLDGE